MQMGLKVKLFPQDTEFFGHRLVNGQVKPSDHIVTSLGKIKREELVTNKQLNSWKGLYKVLSRHLPDISRYMTPFDSATAGKNSTEKFTWTPFLVAKFNKATSH